jgi:DnaK suppressor protein
MSEEAIDLAQIRAKLLELRAEIVREGDVEIEPARKDPSGGGADEDGLPLTEMNQVIASKRNRERTQTLGRIDQALRRLDEDPESFGACLECDEPIGKRLLVMPYVELCVACQQARDQSGQPSGRRHLTDYR